MMEQIAIEVWWSAITSPLSGTDNYQNQLYLTKLAIDPEPWYNKVDCFQNPLPKYVLCHKKLGNQTVWDVNFFISEQN